MATDIKLEFTENRQTRNLLKFEKSFSICKIKADFHAQISRGLK